MVGVDDSAKRQLDFNFLNNISITFPDMLSSSSPRVTMLMHLRGEDKWCVGDVMTCPMPRKEVSPWVFFRMVRS